MCQKIKPVKKKKNKNVIFQHLGDMDYKEVYDYQEKLFAEILDLKTKNRKLPENEQIETPNYLLFCEHPHVYTLGKNGSVDNLLINEEALKSRKATFYKINRGGDITYHGPGQIVGYPIFDLDNFFSDIHKYMRYLEEAVILTLKDYGIEAGRMEKLTGVWLEPDKNPRKICALGVKSSRWVTMHGFAFNVNTNLDYFNNIVPCGITDKAVTSMEKELGEKPNLREIEEKLKKNLVNLFEMNLIEEKFQIK